MNLFVKQSMLLHSMLVRLVSVMLLSGISMAHGEIAVIINNSVSASNITLDVAFIARWSRKMQRN